LENGQLEGQEGDGRMALRLIPSFGISGDELEN